MFCKCFILHATTVLGWYSALRPGLRTCYQQSCTTFQRQDDARWALALKCVASVCFMTPSGRVVSFRLSFRNSFTAHLAVNLQKGAKTVVTCKMKHLQNILPKCFSVLLRATAYMLSAHMLSQFRPSVRLSVRLSVTRVDQSKTAEVRIMQFSPHSSPIPLVFVR